MNRWGKVKTCPHCGGGVTLRPDWKKLAVLFVPFVVVGAVISAYISMRVGFSVAPYMGAFGVIPLLLSMKLVPGIKK